MNAKAATKQRTVRKGDVVDFIYSGVKGLILEYEYRPGQRIILQDLADRFSVSRTPVSQALIRLEREGYAVWRPNRGYQVAEMEASEAGELYSVREALEAYAAEVAAHVRTRQSSAELLERVREYEALKSQPLDRRVLVADRKFHIAIADMAGNATLRTLLDSVFERLIMKRKIEGAISRRDERIREHIAIYRAIVDGDSEVAVRLVRSHVQASKLHLVQHLNDKAAMFQAP